MNSDDKEWFAEEGERQDTPPVKDDGSENNAYEVAKENDLPHTHEEVLQNLSQHPEAVSQHFVESEAIKHGVDFDDKNAQIEPKGYPDSFKSEEEEKTSE